MDNNVYWKCTCGWTGVKPVIYVEDQKATPPDGLEIFCPINCGKTPELFGEQTAKEVWWSRWTAQQNGEDVDEQPTQYGLGTVDQLTKMLIEEVERTKNS